MAKTRKRKAAAPRQLDREREVLRAQRAVLRRALKEQLAVRRLALSTRRAMRNRDAAELELAHEIAKRHGYELTLPPDVRVGSPSDIARSRSTAPGV